jgi:glycosyltransferase involved in cell wall biosynthesis
MSVNATILIPTWNSPLTLRYALASAQQQTEREIEILVVGDGVQNETRELVLNSKERDDRITFLDLPKGENRGERNRHVGVLHARSDVIVYLADDDILMPRHVQNMLSLLETAPFVQSRNTYIDANNALQLYPTDLSDPRWVTWHLEDPPRNRISITGTCHTKKLYARLQEGWAVTPPGMWTDLYLWRQFFRLSDFRGATHNEVTAIQFPAPYRVETSTEDLRNLYEYWYQFSQSHDGHEKLQQLADEVAAKTLVRLSAESDNQSFQIQSQLEVIEQLNTEVKELKESIQNLQRDVEQYEQEFTQLSKNYETLDERLRIELRSRKQLEATLNRITSSFVWRMSRPLRWIRRQLKA